MQQNPGQLLLGDNLKITSIRKDHLREIAKLARERDDARQKPWSDEYFRSFMDKTRKTLQSFGSIPELIVEMLMQVFLPRHLPGQSTESVIFDVLRACHLSNVEAGRDVLRRLNIAPAPPAKWQ